ncbi:MAG: PAS domain S-box protein [Desulfobacteraceae bacterium]|nr:PAS domain S-box protein [Desulfobacteraceae bacterium]
MQPEPSYEELQQRVKTLEAALVKKRDIENIFYALSQPVFILNKNQEIISANPAAERATGMSAQELAGRKCYQIMHDQALKNPPAECPMARLIASGKAETVEMVVESLQGTFLVTCTPVFDPDGQLVRVIHIATDITDKKLAEAQLKQKTALFKFLTENMADIIWTTDLNFKSTYSSPSLEKILGFTPEEREHQTAEVIMTPEALARASELLALEMERDGQPGVDPGRSATIEIENYVKSGGTRWLENNVRFVRDDQGRIIGLMGIARDITERHQAQAKLRDSEEKYRHLMTYAPAGIYEIDFKKGHITTVNDAMCELTGYSREDFMTIAPLDLLTEESQHLYLSRIASGQAGEKISEAVEYQFLTKSGDKRWVALRTRHRYEHAELASAFVVAHDITERKAMEIALRDSERRFRELAELLPETIFEMDAEGRFLFVNRKASIQYGYTQEEFLSKVTGIDIIHPSDRRRAMANFNRVLNGENLGLSEYESLRKDGTTFPSLYHSAPIRQKEKFTGIRGFIIDISEKKSIEARIKMSQKMESIGTLAGGVAHEFNNLLGIIIGNTELALDGRSHESQGQNYLKEIFAASLRAKEVVQQILRFVRKMPSETKPIPIGAVVNDALPLIRATLPKKISLQSKIACGSDIILGNVTEIHQILLNLCANAVHAMRARGGQLTIEVAPMALEENAATKYEGLSAGRHARIVITDTGMGIDPRIIDRIFEPYFTTKAVDEGLGMGLAVVYGIVKHFGGAIKVESQTGEGTSVEVLFPIVEMSDENSAKTSPDVPAGSERILFIDDEASLVRMSKQILERMGYRVHGETESQKALALFKNDPLQFDLVITDLAMPHLEGDRLSQELLKIRPDIPIILYSGFSERIDEAELARLGIRAAATKPLVKSEIAQIIRSVLDNR